MNQLFTKDDVLDYFGISEMTLHRWLSKSRRGEMDFPMPVFPKGSVLRFRKSDIDNWKSSIGNTPPIAPPPPIETPAARKRRAAQVAKELERLGVVTADKMNQNNTVSPYSRPRNRG